MRKAVQDSETRTGGGERRGDGRDGPSDGLGEGVAGGLRAGAQFRPLSVGVPGRQGQEASRA